MRFPYAARMSQLNGERRAQCSPFLALGMRGCAVSLPKGMSSHIHVSLEEHGTAVWRMIDGRRTVQEIIDALGTHFQDAKEYPSRVTMYIMQLRKDGFVRLKIRN